MLTKDHAQLTSEVRAHIDADTVVQGAYWTGSHGCFIGCLAHSDDASVLGDRFGLPEPLVRICESIFEALAPDDAKAFFAAIPNAVGCDGKDLTRVHWEFLALELQALPTVPDEIKAVIEPITYGMLLLVSGQEWREAADAATYTNAVACADANAYVNAVACADADAVTYANAVACADACADAATYAANAVTYATYAADVATYAADAAAYAARAAADAAADATYSAAYVAARVRQRDTILRLIEQVPTPAMKGAQL